MRLFIEAVTDDTALDAAWSAGQRLRGEPDFPAQHVRWVRRDAFHLTLRFLGEIEEARAAAIASALEELSGFGTIPLEIGEWGTFGGRYPRVIWLGLRDNNRRLPKLRDHLDAALARVELEPDPAPFRPHLTLGRVRRQAGRDDLGAIRRAVQHRRPLQIRAELRAAALVESTLHPSGPRYRRLARTEL